MNNKNQYLVSIIIPVYNGSNYLKEAVESALEQTYKNIEIIIVNDGSNDNGKTSKIAQSYVKNYPKTVKYFEKENGGVSTALNLAIKQMKGSYFSWLSHDDIYLPNKIEDQINYLKEIKNPDAIVYSDYELIDCKGKIISECIKDHEMLLKKPEYALLRGTINGITLLIPKKAFEKCGLFDENLRCVQDYVKWNEMKNYFDFFHMPKIVAQSRTHSGQVTVVNEKVKSEGNVLWTNLIKETSKEARIRLEGSEFNFYSRMAIFLSDTPYDEAEKYCVNECSKLVEKTKKGLDKIKVSVVIPFFNRIDVTINAIESVINQTHNNWELLLINDCSTDSLKKLEKVINKNSRIKLINLNKNGGAANARNVGMDMAKGKYIAFLDSDDYFVVNKLYDQLYDMELQCAKISHTSYKRVGFNETRYIPSGRQTGIVIPQMLYSCGIATPTVMILRDYLEKNHFRFNPELIIGEDTCFWLELVRNEELFGIDEPLSVVNVLDSSSAYDIDKQILGYKTIIKYIMNDKEYSSYDMEISYLLEEYIRMVRENKHKTILKITDQSYSLDENNRRIPRIKRLYLVTKESYKRYGAIFTIKRIIKKVVKKINEKF